MATKISDFYDSGEEFEAVLEEAKELAWNNWQNEFLASISKSWENYGVHAYFSQFQNRSLRDIAQYGDSDPDD